MKTAILLLLSCFVSSRLYGQSLGEAAKQQRDKLCKAGHAQFCDKGQKPDPDTTAKGSLGTKEGFLLESEKPDNEWMGEALNRQKPTMAAPPQFPQPQSTESEVKNLQQMVNSLAATTPRQLGEIFAGSVQFPGRDRWEQRLDTARNKFVGASQIFIELLRAKAGSGVLRSAEGNMHFAQSEYNNVQVEGVAKVLEWKMETRK